MHVMYLTINLCAFIIQGWVVTKISGIPEARNAIKRRQSRDVDLHRPAAVAILLEKENPEGFEIHVIFVYEDT